jgi:hypothetical protein
MSHLQYPDVLAKLSVVRSGVAAICDHQVRTIATRALDALALHCAAVEIQRRPVGSRLADDLTYPRRDW